MRYRTVLCVPSSAQRTYSDVCVRFLFLSTRSPHLTSRKEAYTEAVTPFPLSPSSFLKMSAAARGMIPASGSPLLNCNKFNPTGVQQKMRRFSAGGYHVRTYQNPKTNGKGHWCLTFTSASKERTKRRQISGISFKGGEC